LKNLSIGGQSYFISGDVGYFYIAAVHALLFNKKLFQDEKIDFPYEMVRNGTWTFDEFEQIVLRGNKDLNGDSKLNMNDDRFGLVSMGFFADTMYFLNFGGKIIEKDEDDYPVLTLNTPKNAAILEAGYRLFIVNNSPLSVYTAEQDDYSRDLSHIAFMEDRAFFLGTNLKNLRVLRDMQSDYGILPYPKFDMSQPNYISAIEGAVPMMVLPKTADPEFVGPIVEALARESYIKVTPAFYEYTLEAKYTHDEDSVEMLKILRETTYFDAGYFYNFNDSGFMSKIMIEQKNHNLASYTDKNEKAIQRAIEKLVKAYEES